MKNKIVEILLISLCTISVSGCAFTNQYSKDKKPSTVYLQNENMSGYVNISKEAHKDLNVSDNLSKEEIQTLVDYLYENSKCKDVCDFTDIADELYNWQQANNCSVTGILACCQL